MLFLDTSALVKAYLDEPGSDVVRAIIKERRPFVYVSNHVALETLAAFASNLRRLHIQPKRYHRARAEFFRDFPGGFTVVEVPAEVVENAMELADTYRALGVGSIDLVHVATVERLAWANGGVPTIVCADRAMRNLAAAAGLGVFNPETDDPAALPPPG
ncbi:MAG TPA: type II toxin-antitoxin system VapC family toxin [Longimicrobium sp.]|nr:type II toxin-antitoxin system VapC family toxin [Longimicrobium sp.]